MPGGHGLRLTGRSGQGAVGLAGPERLRVLEPLLRFARALRAYGAGAGDGSAASVWELDLHEARLVVALSPEVSRGFSGEGGVLRDLADPQSAVDADLVSALLAFEPRIDVDRLAAQSGLRHDRVGRALVRLGAAGRVGYDSWEGAYFHRELPYDAAVLEPLLSGAPAALARGDKGPVVSTLRLIADAAKAQPDAGERLAPVLAEPLRHEDVEVQERALALLTQLVPDAERRDVLRAAHGDEPVTTLHGATAPAPAFGTGSGPSPPPASPPLEPVADADELADLFARLVEEADDPAEVERLLEGVCRLAQQRPRGSADALRRRLHDLRRGLLPGCLVRRGAARRPRGDGTGLARKDTPGPGLRGP